MPRPATPKIRSKAGKLGVRVPFSMRLIVERESRAATASSRWLIRAMLRTRRTRPGTGSPNDGSSAFAGIGMRPTMAAGVDSRRAPVDNSEFAPTPHQIRRPGAASPRLCSAHQYAQHCALIRTARADHPDGRPCAQAGASWYAERARPRAQSRRAHVRRAGAPTCAEQARPRAQSRRAHVRRAGARPRAQSRGRLGAESSASLCAEPGAQVRRAGGPSAQSGRAHVRRAGGTRCAEQCVFVRRAGAQVRRAGVPTCAEPGGLGAQSSASLCAEPGAQVRRAGVPTCAEPGASRCAEQCVLVRRAKWSGKGSERGRVQEECGPHGNRGCRGRHGWWLTAAEGRDSRRSGGRRTVGTRRLEVA